MCTDAWKGVLQRGFLRKPGEVTTIIPFLQEIQGPVSHTADEDEGQL